MAHFTEHSAREFDCVVIGAGVVGVNIAQGLARNGIRIPVLDAAPEIGGVCSMPAETTHSTITSPTEAGVAPHRKAAPYGRLLTASLR